MAEKKGKDKDKGKWTKKIIKFLASPFVVGSIATLAVTATSIQYFKLVYEDESLANHPFFQYIKQAHLMSFDIRLKSRRMRPPDPRVAILAIDERSLEQEGRWPWPREKTARLVDEAVKAGAKAVAFDIVFSEEDPNSSIPTLRSLRKKLQEGQQITDSVDAAIGDEIQRANSDKYFGDTIGRINKNLILGSYFEDITESSNFPYQDYCRDVIYNQSYSSYYWEKQDILIGAADEPVKELKFPTPIKEAVGRYLDTIEVVQASEWILSHPKENAKLLATLKDLGEVNASADVLPYVLDYWMRGREDSMLEFLKQQMPTLAAKESIFTELGARIDLIVDQKTKSDLWTKIRQSNEEYCGRFLTQDDELLNKDVFQKNWEKKNSAVKFDDFSFTSVWPKFSESNKFWQGTTLEAAVEKIKSKSYRNDVHEVSRWWLDIPVLAKNTTHTGYFNAFLDSDGSVRRSALVSRFGNSYMPSLALKTFLAANDYRLRLNLAQNKINSSLEAKRISDFIVTNADGDQDLLKIPVDGRGQVFINYSGPQKTFPYVSAADVLSDKETMSIEQRAVSADFPEGQIEKKTVNKKEFLKDKILILGATAIGIFDLRVTPLDENYPGVETHANVLSNLLIEQAKTMKQPVAAGALGFMKDLPNEDKYMGLLLVSVGLLLSTILTFTGPLTGFLVTGSSVGAIYAVDRFILFNHGLISSVIFPLALVGSVFGTMTAYKYFTEERKKRELKGTFAKYVSPAIVDELLSDPDNIQLGGRKVELTVFFSDVRGFTTISEKLDPEALSDLLNSYLTPMTDLVFKNKGTLDKYMGDAVMAFFGAPIHYGDHAKHACRCAIQSLQKLSELQAEYRAKGLPEIDIGIGLNTAEVSVGNMGSQTVRSYTVMGDGVNLASRLEGINKQYGTRIIISEFTRKAIGDDFICREMDWVKVKGKKLPVKIYELLSEKTAPQETMELVKCWNEGFDFYHKMSFESAIRSFTQALNVCPTDAASKLYLERCNDYLQNPPPADWDGVFTMTSK